MKILTNPPTSKGAGICYAVPPYPAPNAVFACNPVNKPRKTNVLRPLYRLGWLVIWSTWLATLVLLMPALIPRHDTFQRLLVAVLLTVSAYFVQRLWDRYITGRPLPRARRGG